LCDDLKKLFSARFHKIDLINNRGGDMVQRRGNKISIWNTKMWEGGKKGDAGERKG